MNVVLKVSTNFHHFVEDVRDDSGFTLALHRSVTIFTDKRTPTDHASSHITNLQTHVRHYLYLLFPLEHYWSWWKSEVDLTHSPKLTYVVVDRACRGSKCENQLNRWKINYLHQKLARGIDYHTSEKKRVSSIIKAMKESCRNLIHQVPMSMLPTLQWMTEDSFV